MAALWRSVFGRRDRGSSSVVLLRSCSSFTSSASLSYNSSTKLINQISDEESAYQRALKYKRPPTIKYQDGLKNSVSLIGVVVRPVCPVKSNIRAGAYTVLKVKNTTSSSISQSTHRHFWISPYQLIGYYFSRHYGFNCYACNAYVSCSLPSVFCPLILLNIWGKMAQICTTHLKPGDLIYVSGHLGSYSKADKNGISRTNYEVHVKNINYVQSHIQAPTCERAKQSRVEDLAVTSLDRHNDRLYLWQVYFANPLEWYDNRNSKKSPNHPDFRHKDTGEVLWLKHNDPPWIQKQLELQDSRLAGRQISVSSDLTPLVYDDFV